MSHEGDIDTLIGRVTMQPGACYWYAQGAAARTDFFAGLAAVSCGPHGWLPAVGGTLVNLRVWENILLPGSYYGAAPGAGDSARLDRLLDRLGVPTTDRADFCAARVDALPHIQRHLVVALRTLMSRASLIMVECEWFANLSASQLTQLPAMFQEECPGAVWVAAGLMPPPAAWGDFQPLEDVDVATA